jgi:hypothetical protein
MTICLRRVTWSGSDAQRVPVVGCNKEQTVAVAV